MANSVNTDDIRERILEDASRLFLQYGYKRTTMDDIAAAVGISKGSLYLSFASKEDIFRSVCQQVVQQVLERMRAVAEGPGPADEKLRRIYLDAMLYIWDFSHRAPHAPDLWAEVLEKVSHEAEPGILAGRAVLAGVIEQGQREGLFDPALDAERTAWLVQVAVQGFDAPYFVVSRREQVERGLPQLMALIVRGLEPRSNGN